jgi:hypothetical protein
VKDDPLAKRGFLGFQGEEAVSTEGMSTDPALPGRHRCKLCGTVWHCENLTCTTEKNKRNGFNETLNCLKCDAERAETPFKTATRDLAEAKRKNVRVDYFAERYVSARNKVDRLRKSMKLVYGGFTS